MKKLLLTLALLLTPGLAWGQCNGVFAAATLCGSGAGGVPGPVLASSFPFGQLTVGGLTINPATGATVPGLTINQTISGAVGFGGNAANLIFIGSDIAQGGSSFINHFEISANIGGAAMTGGRQSNATFLNLSSPTSASNPAGFRNYVAVYGNAFSAAGDGGTDTDAGAKGGMFPLATWGDLQSGATNMLGVGNEFDVSIRTGAGAKHKTDLALIEHALDGVSGATTDALLAFSAQAGAIGMNSLITISDFATRHPLKSTGTIMKTATIGSGATAANGIDFSTGITFTGCAYKSVGFCIDPVGASVSRMAANSIKGNNAGSAGNSTDLTVAQAQALLGYPVILGGFVKNLDVNSLSTDTSFTIASPTANYRINTVVIQNVGTTASLTAAQYSLCSAAASGGTCINGAGTVLSALTSNAVNSTVSVITSGPANVAAYNLTTLFFHTTQVQGAAASVNAYVYIQPLP